MARRQAHVLRLNSKICPVFSQSYPTTFFVDFFIPLSAKTYTFESISGKLLWEALAELREDLRKLWEGLEELWETLYID